ncbi:MAG: hypothetical protein ACT4OG_04795 [Alphaproteobacteria bacterium]
MPKPDQFDALTISEPLTVTLPSGQTVTGTLWMHASRKGRFEVEYGWRRKSDGRTDHTSEGHIRGIAKMILIELAQDG